MATDSNSNPEIPPVVVNTNPDSAGDGDLDFNPPDDWGAKLLESLGVDPSADLDPAGTDYGNAVGIDLSKRDTTADDGETDTSADVTEDAVKGATQDAGKEAVEEAATPTQDAPATSESSSDSPETATSEESTEQATEQVAEQVTGGWDYQYLDPATNQASTVHFDDDQVARALQIANWADTLPDELRQQFADVESGTHITVPRTEYDEYVAYKQSSSKQQRDADLDNLDADPQVVELLRKQRDEIEQLKGGEQLDAPQGYANQYANYSATTTAFDQAATAYQSARQLTPDEMSRLYSTTVNSGIVSHLAASKAQYSPTGNLVSPANPAEVLYEALDYHLSRDPALHSAVIQRTNTPAAQQPADISNVPPAAEHSDDAITTKKARASSMSAAPSAAVNPAPRNVAELSDPELVAEIEAFLTPVMRET